MTELNLSLSDLLFWPVSLPTRGFVFLLEQLRDAADQELYNPQVLQRRLVELQMMYEFGEVSESEYRTQWEALSRRLASLGPVRSLPE